MADERTAATTESWEQREERWIDWTSRPYQFVPLNLYDETQKLSEIAVGEMLAEIERLRKAARMKSAARDRLCERCDMRTWNDLWSPDGLVGHEILVCHPCWETLDAEAKREAPRRTG